MHTDYTKHVRNSSLLVNDVITSHLLIENYLRRAVAGKLQKPNAILTDQGPSFSVLVSLAEALGVIQSDMARVARAVNTLRNRYAHRLGFEASQNEVEVVLRALREMEAPFFLSQVPGTERELALALASLTGWFERTYGPLQVA